MNIKRAGHPALVRKALKGNDLEGDGLQGLLSAGGFFDRAGRFVSHTPYLNDDMLVIKRCGGPGSA